MLQKIKIAEKEMPETPAVAPEVGEPICAPAEAPGQLEKVTGKDLAIIVQTGITRNKRRTRILDWTNEIYRIAWWATWVWGCLHSFLYFEWMMCLMPVSWIFRRVAFDVFLLHWAQISRLTEQYAAKRLIASEDVMAVASLVDLLQWTHDKALRPELWQALGRLLPRLSEEQVQELGKERHGILATWMAKWERQAGSTTSAPLLGILHVLGAVGQFSLETPDRFGVEKTISLLPLLKKWGSGLGEGQNPTVQQAAIACRQAIEQKIALARSGEQLLRATAAPEVGADSLLRPAQGTSPTPPHELLRPGGSE